MQQDVRKVQGFLALDSIHRRCIRLGFDVVMKLAVMKLADCHIVSTHAPQTKLHPLHIRLVHDSSLLTLTLSGDQRCEDDQMTCYRAYQWAKWVPHARTS